MLKKCRDRYTDDQISRAGHLGIPFGDELSRIFSEWFTYPKKTKAHSKSDKLFEKEIPQFVATYQQYQLVLVIHGREMRGKLTKLHSKNVKFGSQAKRTFTEILYQTRLV